MGRLRVLSGREACQILEQHGFVEVPRRGSHMLMQARNKKPVASVVVVETKGKHLKGNEDTKYKRAVAKYFEKVGTGGTT